MEINPLKQASLGVSKTNNYLQFSLFSEKISSCFVHLFQKDTHNKIKTIPLQYDHNGVFTATTEVYPPDTEYMFEVDGRTVLDPYAKALSTTNKWGESKEEIKCQLTYDHFFNFEGVEKPIIKEEDLIIYEMHVRGLTKDPSSKATFPGTYLGVIEKIPYLKSLGVNAIELLPIFEFDETENHFIDPTTGKSLFNYWGYSTLNFFCPMKRYATNSERLTPLTEFKMLVKELHKNEMAIILDVVYNHVSPSSCLDIIDKEGYFILSKGHHTNFTGCGNTISANSKASLHLILSSLSYYAEECQVDGFRFDLGGALTRGEHAEILKSPPLFKSLETDPIFKKVFFFAEPWDCGNVNLQNHFPSTKVIEWEGNYKRIVKQYVHKTQENTRDFLQAIFPPLSSKLKVHYITCHDGFSLRDLVSYDHKHNERNGEESRDGESYNFSYNYGHEGESFDIRINFIRNVQIKNFIFINLFSLGIPMIKMGDEYGMTHDGNNNVYCHDGPINWMNWDIAKNNEELVNFTEKAIEIRKKINFYTRDKESNVPLTSNVYIAGRSVAFLVKNNYLFVFNPFEFPLDLTHQFPGKWNTLISTNKTFIQDKLIIPTFSCLVAENDASKEIPL